MLKFRSTASQNRIVGHFQYSPTCNVMFKISTRQHLTFANQSSLAIFGLFEYVIHCSRYQYNGFECAWTFLHLLLRVKLDYLMSLTWTDLEISEVSMSFGGHQSLVGWYLQHAQICVLYCTGGGHLRSAALTFDLWWMCWPCVILCRQSARGKIISWLSTISMIIWNFVQRRLWPCLPFEGSDIRKSPRYD